jgi:putative resolvase
LLTGWVTASGMSVDEFATEVGSAVNGRRRKLGRLLADPAAAQIVVGHRDQLARFGVGHLQAAVAAQGRRVLILDQGQVGDDLVGDMTGVLTLLCARLYGRRGARDRALRAVSCAGSAGSTGA